MSDYLPLHDREDRPSDEERWRELVASDGPDRWKNIILVIAIGAIALGGLGLFRTFNVAGELWSDQDELVPTAQEQFDPSDRIRFEVKQARRIARVDRAVSQSALVIVAIVLDGVFIAGGVGLLLSREWGRKVVLTALILSIVYTVLWFALWWEWDTAQTAIERDGLERIAAQRGRPVSAIEGGLTGVDLLASFGLIGTLIVRGGEIVLYGLAIGTLFQREIRKRLLPPPRPKPDTDSPTETPSSGSANRPASARPKPTRPASEESSRSWDEHDVM